MALIGNRDDIKSWMQDLLRGPSLTFGHSTMERVAESRLGADFFKQVERIDDPARKLRWYYCVVVNLAAVNYPELITEVWQHCWIHLCETSNHEQQFWIAQKLRESLIIATGIMGAARVSLSMKRLLR